VGVSLYGLDGLISLLVHDWLGLGFHVFVVIMILKGFQAARHLAARATRTTALLHVAVLERGSSGRGLP
jgi:hypothetical protein